MRLVAITGGIGSGKSVVSAILLVLGYPVYDCDSNAKRIMDNDMDIKRRVAADVCADAVDAYGRLDRTALAEAVFNDSDKLSILNSIVHQAVRNDIACWTELQTSPMCFVETAILYQSGLDRMVDEVWDVDAPVEMRVERVCRRNGLSVAQVMARVKAQDFTPECRHHDVRRIINDGRHSLLLQLDRLIGAQVGQGR